MAGDVAIKITADSSQLSKEFGKVVSQSKAVAGQITGAFRGVQGALAGIGVGLSAGAFVGLVKGSIDAADHLQDLSQKTGVAVETLGGIGFAAKQAGSDLDSVAKGFGKFNLNIAKATGGDQDAAAAFDKIGISIAELKALKPEEVFARTADAFNKFADGPNKAAIASELFGKSYKEIIPLLNEGGDALRKNIAYFQKYSGLTKELAENSDKFNDEVEKAKLLSGAFGNALAAKLLPSLQALVELFVEAKEKGDGFNGTADTIVDGLKNIAKGAVIVGREIVGFVQGLGALAAIAVSLAKLDFKAVAAIDSDLAARNRQLSIDRDKILDAIDGKTTGSGLPGPKRNRPPAPSLGSKDADSTRKALLDQSLKALDDQIREEQDLLKDREHFLQAYYQDDEIGFKEFFDQRRQVQADAIEKQRALFDQEIAALQKFAASAKPTDRIEAETKIAEVVAKRAKLEQDSAVKSIHLWFEQRKAAKEFRDQIEDISIALAQMSGDSITAGLAAFDKANEKFRRQAELRAVSPDLAESAAGNLALKKLDDLRAETALQLQLNKAQTDFRNRLEDIGIATAKINIQQQLGNITTLDAINQRSQLAKDNIARLQAEAAAYEEIAQKEPANSQAREDAIRNVQRLKLEIQQLEVAATELERTFRDVFTGAVSDGLTELITGTKSVKEAFKDMEKQIVSSISRIASQNIAESIFGKSGAGGGIVDLFSKLFGGGGGAGGFLSSLFGGGSGFGMNVRAAGGPIAANQPYLVGEKGPEIIVPKMAGNVIPNDVLNARRGERGSTVIVNSYAMPGATRATADQAAFRTGVAAQRALARNG